MQSAHTNFCQKLFSGRETPLLLHSAENYLMFVRLNSSTLKKENPPRAQRAAVTKLRHFEGFCRFEVVCVVCCVCSVVCLVLSLCVLSVVCGSVSALPQCCCSTAPVLPQYRPSAHPVLVQYLHSIDPVLPQYCPSTAPVLPQYLFQ